jgi:hypothetical protein
VSEETAIVRSEAANPLILVHSPEEMATASARLAGWAEQKLMEAKADLAEIEQTLQHAKAVGWPTASLATVARRKRKDLVFYEKAEAAFRAGYYMVPNFDIDVVAIRTSRGRPKGVGVEHKTTVFGGVRTPDVETESPPLGEGRTVSSLPEVYRGKREGMKGTGQNPNEKVTLYTMEITDFRDFTFPAAFVKPAVIDDVQRAVVAKLFDEIGILPHRSYVNRGDPMVIGRIVTKDGWRRRSL